MGQPAATGERRSRVRIRSTQPKTLKIQVSGADETRQEIQVELFDTGSGGIGVVAPQALPLQGEVTVVGNWADAEGTQRASVRWCRPTQSGRFRIGLLLVGKFAEQQRQAPKQEPRTETLPSISDTAVDYYELLQVHPKADQETIHRVYRLMAQRYHPDNIDTGNRERFEMVSAAFRTLSNMELRVTYDLETKQERSQRWNIFDQTAASKGVPEEKRKREGILGVLYTKRIHEPNRPVMSIQEIEELLGVPREHLEFSLWYLKEQGQITRSDNGRFSVTIKGVDAAEHAQCSWQIPQSKWLEAPDREMEPA